VEPEETYIARQRLGKQVSAATGTQATIEELLGTMFSIRSVQGGYKVVDWLSSCGGGDEHHRDPASRRRRRKGNSQT
jgi:hypothetical protein